MATKIEGSEKQVKAVEEAQKAQAHEALKMEAHAEEQRLFRHAKAALEFQSGMDDLLTGKRREIAEEQAHVERLRGLAQRLQEDAALVQATVVASEKRLAVLSKEAHGMDALHSFAGQEWSEALQRWEKFRHLMGLPFFDPEAGPPTWFVRAYEQAGLLKLFSAP